MTKGYTAGFGWAAVVMAIGVVVIAIAVEKFKVPPKEQEAAVAAGEPLQPEPA